MGRSHTKDRRKRSRSRSPHQSQKYHSTSRRSYEHGNVSENDFRDSRRYERVRDNPTNSQRKDLHETSRDRYVYQYLSYIAIYLILKYYL